MAIFVFIFGAIMASFTSCLAVRQTRGESIIYPPSHCDSCKRRLKAYENIPIFSFIFKKGRCECGYKIGIENLLVEILLPIIFTIYYLKIGLTIEFFTYIIIVLILTKLSLTDLWTHSVFERDLILLLIISFLKQVHNFIHGNFIISIGITQIVLLALYFIVDRLEKTPIGEGDILVYLSLITFLKPIQALYFFLLSNWLALLPAIYLKYKNEDFIPMLPFISLSFIIVHIIGVYL